MAGCAFVDVGREVVELGKGVSVTGGNMSVSAPEVVWPFRPDKWQRLKVMHVNIFISVCVREELCVFYILSNSFLFLDHILSIFQFIYNCCNNGYKSKKSCTLCLFL
jgi:hypothetical protein